MHPIRIGLSLLCLAVTLSLSGQSLKGLIPTDQIDHRPILPYPPVREADIMYATHIDRVIDTREKLNLPFRHPERGFFLALQQGLDAGAVQLYDPAFPDFSQLMDPAQWSSRLYRSDTIPITDPTTGKVHYEVVTDEFNPDRILRYRIREIVYFDRQTSTQKRRIIGIAPLVSETDEMGTTTFEYPLGWIYWPDARHWFGHKAYYLAGTDLATISWDDALEMRRFSSYVTRTPMVTGARIRDHYSGRDALLQSQGAERSLSNREHDLWSY